MAYNTKPIVTDVDGNPISQYYNKELDQYEPVEGSGGGNKVVLYNADGTENNSLSLIPILEKLSELTGTVIDEQTRQSNEQQRITFYNQLVEMLNTGQLKGDKGDTGETGRGLEFDWDGTRLGVRVEGDEEYIYVDLRGPQGPPGVIENLTSQHIEDTLGYLPVSPNDLEELRQEVGEAHTSLNDRLGDLENLDTTEKANLVLALNEIYQELAAHKAESVSQGNPHGIDAKADKALGIKYQATRQNGWQLAGSYSLGYYKDSFGFIHIEGSIQNGTIGSVIFTLPAGYRPFDTQVFEVAGYDETTAYIEINPNGEVKHLGFKETAPYNNITHLYGIYFREGQ